MVRTATDLYNYLQCFSRRDCNRKEVEDPPPQQTMAGPDRIFPEEHHQAKMYLKKPADSATAEDEKCQDIYNGANRLSQSQSTWLHCGQEICNKSQEISVNIHAFVIVASEISYFFLEKINSFVFETRIYFL